MLNLPSTDTPDTPPRALFGGHVPRTTLPTQQDGPGVGSTEAANGSISQTQYTTATSLDQVPTEKEEGAEAPQASAEHQPPAAEQAPEIDERRLRFQTVAELASRPRRTSIVAGLLFQRTLATVYGLSNCGKSFLAIELACCIASGLPFYGRKTQQGSVAYIAGEGSDGVVDRIRGWCAHHELDPDELRILVLTTAPDLLMKANRECDVSELIEELEEGFRSRGLPLPSMIIIDTLWQSFGGGDENSVQDMGGFIRACGTIRDRTGSTVMILHHSGKDASRGERGHSSLRAAMDTAIGVEKTRKIEVTATVEKQKDVQSGAKFQFLITPVEFRDQASGETIQTAVILPDASDNTVLRMPSAKARAALRVLREAGPEGLSMIEWLEKGQQQGGPARSRLYEYAKELEQAGLIEQFESRYRAV